MIRNISKKIINSFKTVKTIEPTTTTETTTVNTIENTSVNNGIPLQAESKPVTGIRITQKETNLHLPEGSTVVARIPTGEIQVLGDAKGLPHIVSGLQTNASELVGTISKAAIGEELKSETKTETNNNFYEDVGKKAGTFNNITNAAGKIGAGVVVTGSILEHNGQDPNGQVQNDIKNSSEGPSSDYS